MIELSQLSVLIMVEVMIGLAVISGVLGYLALTRKGRIRKAAHHLAERVQSDKQARGERLKALLSTQYGLTGSQLEQTRRDITEAEMRLFQNLINGYMKDDQVLLQQVDVDEENLVLAYQGLKPAAGDKAAAMATLEGGDEEVVQRLQDENQRLSDELRVTMDTMGRMLNEYSSMFAGGADKPLTREVDAAPADAQDEATTVVSEPLPEAVDNEVEIPDLQATDMAVESLSASTDVLLDDEQDEESSFDEEVSEIIDEVMEMADDMQQDEPVAESGDGAESIAPSADVGESLLDELEQVDIEIPDQGESENPDEMAAEPEPEPGSLEAEWAKLLEDDASQEKSEDK